MKPALLLFVSFLIQDPSPYKEQRLVEVSADLEIQRTPSPVYSLAGTQVAYAVRRKSEYWVEVNGKKSGPVFKSVSELRMLADGKTVHVGYREAGTFVVVGDDIRGPYELVRMLDTSADRTSFAYLAFQDGRTLLCVGDRDPMEVRSARIFTARKGPGLAALARRDGRTFVVTPGKQYGPFDSANNLQWSADGRRLVFEARIDEKAFVQSGDRRLKRHRSVRETRISRDGSVIAYRATDPEGREWFQVGKKKYEAAGRLFLSPDGKQAAWYVGGRIIVNGKVIVRVERIPIHIWFTDKGEPVFVSRSGRTQRLYIGDKAGPEHLRIHRVLVSENGKTVAYVAWKKPDPVLVVNGKEREVPGAIGSIRLSPDGTTIAAPKVEFGKETWVINGRKSGWYDRIDTAPEWAPDGRTLIRQTLHERKWFVEAGDRKSETFDGDVRYIVHPGGRQIGVGGRRGREFWWTSIPIGK